MKKTTRRARSAPRLALATLLCAVCAPIAGCWAPQLIGGMAESYKRTSTRTVPAEYTGLEGKSFAVVVAADRAIQGQHPQIVENLLVRVSDRLRTHANASGFVPPDVMIRFTSNNPRWVALTYGELMEELEVDRLVFVDLTEFRLNEPGNRYLWDGAASALLGVAERESYAPDEFVYRRDIRVKFPDSSGYGPQDMSRDIVASALMKRLTDRVTWLFYEHEEPYYPDY